MIPRSLDGIGFVALLSFGSTATGLDNQIPLVRFFTDSIGTPLSGFLWSNAFRGASPAPASHRGDGWKGSRVALAAMESLHAGLIVGHQQEGS
jgi:hypothetical protein